MRGFSAEAMIVSGTFLYSSNITLAVVLLCLGIVSGFFKFLIHVNSEQKRDRFFDAGEKVFCALVSAADTIDPTTIFNAQHDKTVH